MNYKALSIILGLSCLSSPLCAQQPNITLDAVELTKDEYVFETAEQGKIRVVVVATGLTNPMGVAVLPSGDALVSERSGALRLIRNARGASGEPGTLEPAPIAGLPSLDPYYYGGGLHDVTLHPQFERNGLIYFTFNKPDRAIDPQNMEGPLLSHLALFRARLAGHTLVDVTELYAADEPEYSGPSRIAFGKDGTIYVTSSAPFGDAAQRLGSMAGKILRLTPDGQAPSDNPFTGVEGAKPEVFSLGHRDQFGLAVHPVTGAVLNAEHGPNGGDEVNLILPGRNYGWPEVTFGRNYDGSLITESPVGPGFEDPLVVWLPSIAPTSLMVYDGDRFPQWRGNLFVGSARRGQINRTGGLERVVVNENMGELRREPLLTDLRQRVHGMTEGPDGIIYVLTYDRDVSEDAGALLRIEPLD